MAAIGKIRSWGPVLATVIGLALFAFIAEEFFRSCESTTNEKRQQVGEVLGKKISVQDFQSLVDEYQSVIKMTQGRDNLSEEELNQVKDQVWQQYVNNTIMEAEAKKLGLTVTDEELQISRLVVSTSISSPSSWPTIRRCRTSPSRLRWLNSISRFTTIGSSSRSSFV